MIYHFESENTSNQLLINFLINTPNNSIQIISLRENKHFKEIWGFQYLSEKD
jgi:hypothetical protein